MKINKLRTKKTWDKYLKYKDKAFVYGELISYHWFGSIHENPYPYDNVAETHHIVWLHKPYLITYWLLLPYYLWLFKEYDSIMINLNNKSIPDKPHIHLINWIKNN